MDVNEEANRLEQALFGLSLPVRIQGGQVREGGVRYMATPLNRTTTEQFQRGEGSIALAGGTDAQGAPPLLPLHQPGPWHAAILGTPGFGKSELLRSMIVSLSLTNRQSVVQLFGIDRGA